MAVATLTNVHQRTVAGDLRYVGADTIVFANNSDTWNTGLKHVEAILLTNITNGAFGFTVSAGIITLVAAAGATFRGGVLGRG